MKAALREGDSISRLGDEFVARCLTCPMPRFLVNLLVRRLLGAVSQAVQLAGAGGEGLGEHRPDPVPAGGGGRRRPVAAPGRPRHVPGQARRQEPLPPLRHRARPLPARATRPWRRSGGALRAGEFRLLYQPRTCAAARWWVPSADPLAASAPGELEPAASCRGGGPPARGRDRRLGDRTGARPGCRLAARGIVPAGERERGARHLQAADFMPRLQVGAGAPPPIWGRALELEVLETSALESIAQVTRIVEACARIGVSFALDDLGRHSSLAYLQAATRGASQDRPAVRARDGGVDAEDLAILKAIMGLADAFKREAIAEGSRRSSTAASVAAGLRGGAGWLDRGRCRRKRFRPVANWSPPRRGRRGPEPAPCVLHPRPAPRCGRSREAPGQGARRGAQATTTGILPIFACHSCRAGVRYAGALGIDCDRHRHVLHGEFVDRLHAEVGEADDLGFL